ncbi:type IV secretion system DNA-binding domain-containing protein, partial [bacterium]|nr:type IV secretion system DNA-binding domain-containing protein [bacterium]
MTPLHDRAISYFARTNYRDKRQVFGIRQKDRLSHMYIIGKTGTGKSTLLETLIRQDIEAGRGLCFLDPHGDVVERIAAEVQGENIIYFNAPDRGLSFGFNPLARVAANQRALVASGILDAFKKIWVDSWGPRLEHILRHALLTLLDQPSVTLADILRLFHDGQYRKHAAGRVSNANVRAFWLEEYESYPARLRAEAIAPIQNKVGAFLAHPTLQRILTGYTQNLNLRSIMDEGKVLLVNLAKGKLGEDTASLFGSVLAAMISMSALSRADVPEDKRRDFFLYIDEFASISTLSFATMLSELRKYRTGLILSHQYLGGLDERVRAAIFGNVGTMITFRVGAEDADLL